VYEGFRKGLLAVGASRLFSNTHPKPCSEPGVRQNDQEMANLSLHEGDQYDSSNRDGQTPIAHCVRIAIDPWHDGVEAIFSWVQLRMLLMFVRSS
jgi:hypothetical protein